MQFKVSRLAALTGAVFLANVPSDARAADQAPPVLKAPAQQASSSFFEFSIDGVYATRGSGQPNRVIVQDTITGAPIIASNNFSHGWEPGIDARVRAGQGGTAFEIRYFGGFDFTSSFAATSSPIWDFPTNPNLFGLGVANLNAVYSSRLHSAEANLQWMTSPQLTVFLGARIVAVREKLRVGADFGGNSATVTWGTDFVGVGPQIGAVWRAFGSQTPAPGSAFVDFDLRAAWLRGSSDASFGVVQAVGPAFTADGNHSYWTYAAEAGVKAGYAFGPNAHIHIGYRILYIGDVPLAPGQVAGTNVLTARIGKSTDEYWIHGVNAGLVVRY